MNPATKATETLRQWRENAPFWAKHTNTIRTMFMPLTEALIEDAKIRAGQSVLDVAGGAGEPSLTMAEKVGAKGSVTCSDAVAEMIATAESEARRRGLHNVMFRQCEADALPFDDNSFDAIVCRLGLMFFPAPLASLREMLRVLKPGRKVSLAVWGRSELNPFTQVVTDVVSGYVASPPAGPEAPGAFRFAEQGKLKDILKRAGAVEVRERSLHFRIAAPITIQEYWTLRSETSDTLRQKLEQLSEATVRQIREEVLELGRDYFPNNQMNFPAHMLIVTGEKAP